MMADTGIGRILPTVEAMKSLWQALPFMTFLVGLALGRALMYVLMWKLRQRLAKGDGAIYTQESVQ